MLFPHEHTQFVKDWIVKRLENISDADADVLADYVIALLEHEGDVATVRRLCEAEIPDFLKEDSTEFIDDVFRAIQHQSYLPGAPPLPPRQRPLPPQAPLPPASLPSLRNGPNFDLPYDDVSNIQAPSYPPLNPGGSRKRSYYERDDLDPRGSQNLGDQRAGGGRQLKQTRRHGPRARRDWDNPNNANGYGQRLPSYDTSFLGGGKQWFPPSGAGAVFDLSSGTGMFNSAAAPGTGAPFDPAQAMQQLFPLPPPGTPGDGEYDPSNASLVMNNFMPILAHGHGPQSNQRAMKGGARQQKNSSRRSRKAEVSADGPVFDRKRSTLVIENIPPESLNEGAVREFFSQFGNIVQVSMDSSKRLALVKFDTWNAANAAFQSPKVVFENRFVKVFWYKGDQTSLLASTSGKGAKGAHNGHNKNGDKGDKPVDDQTSGPAPELEINMDEFIRKQGELQKTQEEKRQKMQDLEQQQEELQKKQKDLFLKRQEEIARLNAKIALSTRKSASDSTTGPEGSEGSATPIKQSTQTEILRAQLAALEKEAIEMGIDPHADVDSESQFSSSTPPWASRGRGFGRARGGSYFRARGRAPRGGFRGGYVAGSNDVTYAAYSLDNRPRKVAIIGVDFTIPEKDETLRAYLFGIGEFTDISTTISKTEIAFKDRKTAEKFISSVPGHNIPGIDGEVDLAWVAANGTLIKPAPSTPRAENGDEDLDPAQKLRQMEAAKLGLDLDAIAAAGSGDDKEVSIVLDRPVDTAENGDQAEQGEHAEHGYMDYDVADDNQWDIG